jgi:predicted nucleic acid-binding protein
MIYIDSSSLLKLLWNEPESSAVIDAVASEENVFVSVLAELETLVQLKAAWLGGDYTLPRLRQLEAQFTLLKNQPPYEFRAVSSALFQTAFRQHRNAGEVHCRSIDRLHLAAMEELDLTRLMTHDKRQAKTAAEAGFEVLCPGLG